MGLPEIIHLGAKDCVTGSCHLLKIKDLNILIDCGITYGNDRVTPFKEWPIHPSEIDFLFVTHAHMDHIGRIPELIEHGFQGEILTTHATKALLYPMLEDGLELSGRSETERERLLKVIDELSWGFEYNQYFDLKSGIRFKFYKAGHILGSCFIKIEARYPDFSIIFSGDLGMRDTPLLPDPDPPDPCDLLIMESTYGNRVHEGRDERRETLSKILLKALSDGGKVFIPAFALGRIQELIYDMDRIFSSPEWNQKIPVFIDSPLGLEVTEIYSRLSQFWDKEAKKLLYKGDHPLDFKYLYSVKSYDAHKRLMEMEGSGIIVAGSGMCTGGRIVEHLIWGLEDPKNDVIFVGYQAEGTPGRDIIRYHRKRNGYVILEGERITINAGVYVLNGYSAHADKNGLLEWVESMGDKPGEIRLVHGEPDAQAHLKRLLHKRGYNIR